MKGLKKDGKMNILAIAASVVLIFLFISFFGYTCPIRFLTGFYCPGCGMTRAWRELLSGNAGMAFYYHPLFLLPLPMAFLIVFEKRVPRRIFNLCMGVMAALFLIVYIIRVVKGSSFIDNDFHKGFIWRSLQDGINLITRQK